MKSSRHSRDDSCVADESLQYFLPSQKSQFDDKGMFSYQHTRQLSTSPPPLISYQSYPPTTGSLCGPDVHKRNYFSLPITSSEPSYMLPQPHGFTNCLPMAPPTHVKQEYYEEDDVNPFSLSYASMGGVDIPTPYNSYQTPLTLVRNPPLHTM